VESAEIKQYKYPLKNKKDAQNHNIDKRGIVLKSKNFPRIVSGEVKIINIQISAYIYEAENLEYSKKRTCCLTGSFFAFNPEKDAQNPCHHF
jgi:hypothetical protein